MKIGARALSPHPRYYIQVFPARERIVMDARGYGNLEVLEEGVGAQFQQGGLFDHEIEYVFENFNFTGLPDGVSPLTRVGTFDVETFCQRYPEKARGDEPGRAEMATQITARLKELQTQFPGQFVVVEPPVAARPWPSYDEEPEEEILKLQERLGIDPGIIRAYEEENDVRPGIMYRMLSLEGNSEEAEKYAPAEESAVEESVEPEAKAPENVVEQVEDDNQKPVDGKAADEIVVQA